MSGEGALWDQMIDAAERERERKLQGKFVVERSALPVELSPFGFVRWYLHPSLTDINTTAVYFWEVEIPPGSNTGSFRHQGGIVHFVVTGEGYSTVDGERHNWKTRDLLGLAPLPDGAVAQHFNTGDEPARIIIAFPNYDSALGPELGVAMEVLEPCPEYAARDRA